MNARTFTPDEVTVDEQGHRHSRITMKRVCNGCGEYVGDVTDAEMDCAVEGRPLPDVRGECEHCAPVVALEQAGCATWQVTPQSFTRVADEIDRLRPWVFTKGYYQPVGPEQKITVVGLRVGTGEDRVVACWDDWIIRHPDGTFTVHAAPSTTPEEGDHHA